MLLDYLSSLRPLFSREEILLVLTDDVPVDPALGIRDGYTFSIYERRPRRRAGYISLRMGESPQLFYLGHIGYRIEEPCRGHGYAALACRMLFPLFRQLGLKSIVITANPENTPSRKTCENIGCVLESTVDVPREYRCICSGAARKCRYILRVPEA